MTEIRFHHVTLSVSDAEASGAWYQALLGPAQVVRRVGPDWVRVRLQWPTGTVIGLTQHAGTVDGDRFHHARVGLDHIGLTCTDQDEVQAWAARLDALGSQGGRPLDLPHVRRYCSLHDAHADIRGGGTPRRQR